MCCISYGNQSFVKQSVKANQMTGFYMKCNNTEFIKWVKENMQHINNLTL